VVWEGGGSNPAPYPIMLRIPPIREADMQVSWLTIAILGAVAILVAGIALRAMLSSENPPAWIAFIARRKAQGEPTRWKQWKDDDDR